MSAPVSLAYFGKIPSRGDFIRSHAQAQMIAAMDRWLSQALEHMAQDPHWKACYDQAQPLHFAFLNPTTPRVVAGHLLPSADQSGRRFPMLTLGTLEVPSSQGFTSRGPLALNRLWLKLEHAAQTIHQATDPAAAMADFAQLQIDIEADPGAYDAGYRDYLELQTVGSLQDMLSLGGHEMDLRLSMMALGLLLESVPANGNQPIDKGLGLPLPKDLVYRPYVATLWMDLVARFLARTNMELAVFLPQGAAKGQTEPPPMMYLGFTGGDAYHLAAMLDARGLDDDFVDIRQADWAQPLIEETYGTKKLSSYLQQPQLSLHQAVNTFAEAFLGQ